MRIILAITAASGAIYARQLAQLLLRATELEQLAIILSPRAAEVMQHEREQLPEDDRILYFDNDNLFAAPASGSARYEAMVIAPCSMGTLGRIASGSSESLITRAADVMLKERRRLILITRESPLSLIHLRNMVTLTECGAIIMPASPSHYMHPTNIEELILSVTSRAAEMCGVAGAVQRWGDGV